MIYFRVPPVVHLALTQTHSLTEPICHLHSFPRERRTLCRLFGMHDRCPRANATVPHHQVRARTRIMRYWTYRAPVKFSSSSIFPCCMHSLPGKREFPPRRREERERERVQRPRARAWTASVHTVAPATVSSETTYRVAGEACFLVHSWRRAGAGLVVVVVC